MGHFGADEGGAGRGQGTGVKLGGRAENLKNAELGRQRAAECRRAKAASRIADFLLVIDTIRAEGVTSAAGIARALNERYPHRTGLETAGGPGPTTSAKRTYRPGTVVVIKAFIIPPALAHSTCIPIVRSHRAAASISSRRCCASRGPAPTRMT